MTGIELPKTMTLSLDGKPNGNGAKPAERSRINGELFGESEYLLPHSRTFSGIINTVSRVYSFRFDEAMRHAPANAIAMRHDAYFAALIQERITPLSRWEWQIEIDADDKKAAGDKGEEIRQSLESIVRATWAFDHMREYLGEFVWPGRYGAQVVWGESTIGGQRRKVIKHHRPVDGDKILTDFDGCPAVAVYPSQLDKYNADSVREVRLPAGADKIKTTDKRGAVVYTDRFPVLKLDRSDYRQRFIIPIFKMRDGDYYDPYSAGMVGGIGLRHYAYWAWWLRDEMLAWATDFMEKVGSLGIMLFFYEESNPAQKANAITAAKSVGNGNALACPVARGDSRAGGVELLPANLGGVQFLTQFIGDYFEGHIERLIVGQKMSADHTGSGGLGGSGAANFAMDTKYQLLASDAVLMSWAFTQDLVKPALEFNYPGCPWKYHFKLVVPAPDSDKKLENVSKAFSMGVDFAEDDVRELTGVPKPAEDAKTLRQIQQEQQQQQMQSDAINHPTSMKYAPELVGAMLKTGDDPQATAKLSELANNPDQIDAIAGDSDSHQSPPVTDGIAENGGATAHYAWVPGTSRGGKVKAIGTAEHEGRTLYGEDAERALRGKPTKAGPELPTGGKPAKSADDTATKKADKHGSAVTALGILDNPHLATAEDVGALADHLKNASAKDIRQLSERYFREKKGLKTDVISKLVAYAKGQRANAGIDDSATPEATPATPDVAGGTPEAGGKDASSADATASQPSPTVPQHDANHEGKPDKHAVHEHFRSALAASDHLSEGQRAHYGRSIDRALSAMPSAAHDLIAQHVKDVSFHKNTDDVGHGVIEALQAAPDATLEGSKRLSAFARALNAGKVKPGAAWVPKHGGIHLDGDLGEHYQAHEVYAHSLGHAIDGPDKKISKSRDWQAAWEEEIAPGGLSKYAGKSAHEGFAEFCRLVYGADNDPKAMEAIFPKASAAMQARGLWPESAAGGDTDIEEPTPVDVHEQPSGVHERVHDVHKTLSEGESETEAATGKEVAENSGTPFTKPDQSFVNAPTGGNILPEVFAERVPLDDTQDGAHADAVLPDAPPAPEPVADNPDHADHLAALAAIPQGKTGMVNGYEVLSGGNGIYSMTRDGKRFVGIDKEIAAEVSKAAGQPATQPNEHAEHYEAIAKRFGIPAAAVRDVLETHPDKLAKRSEYNPPSSSREDAVGPTTDYEKHPLRSARIDDMRHRNGETDEAYVDYLTEFDPHALKLSEHEDGMRKSGSVAAYVDWAKQGHEPPPITVFDSSNGNGDLVSTNRRRVLAAQMAGSKTIKGWHGVQNKETGNPLKYGDIRRAFEELKSGKSISPDVAVDAPQSVNEPATENEEPKSPETVKHEKAIRALQNKVAAWKRKHSLANVVVSEGGIDPTSIKGDGGVRELQQRGIHPRVFRSNKTALGGTKRAGMGVDVMAEMLHSHGHIRTPDHLNHDDHLLDQLSSGAVSLNAPLHELAELENEIYQRELAHALSTASPEEVASAVRSGAEQGAHVAQDAPEAHDAREEDDIAQPVAEQQDDGEVSEPAEPTAEDDDSFDFGANATPEHAELAAKLDEHFPSEQDREVDLPESNTFGAFRAKLKPDGNGNVDIVHSERGHVAATIPERHVNRFLDEMHGRINHVANSGHPSVDAVLSGGGKYLGKGHEAQVHDAGDGNVVKAASLTPFHWNNGLRSPDDANKIIHDSVEAGNDLINKGVPGILPQQVVDHDGRAFSVMPKVDTTTPLTAENIGQLEETLNAMHGAGYHLRDEVQVGLGEGGRAHIYDVGSVSKLDGKHQKDDKEDDFNHLKRLAKKHGIDYKTPEEREIPGRYEEHAESIRNAESMDPKDAKLARLKLRGIRAQLKDSHPEQHELTQDEATALDEKLSGFVEGKTSAPDAPEDLSPGRARDLFGAPVFRTKKGTQLSLNELAREVWPDKAREWAESQGKTVDQITAGGRFRVGDEWYTIGNAETGYKVDKADAPKVDGTPDTTNGGPDMAQGGPDTAAPRSGSKVEMVRAPAGGAVSDVDGKFYHGGQLMPIHGLSVKSKSTGTGTADGGPQQANENAKEKSPRTPRREMTPEEIEEKRQEQENQRKWDDINAGPLGKLAWHGDRPNHKALSTDHTRIKDWRQYAESIGPEGVKKLIAELEPQLHAAIERDAPNSEDADWYKNDKKTQADYYRTTFRGGVKHEKAVPDSHYANELVKAMLEDRNSGVEDRIDRRHKMNELLKSVQPATAGKPGEAIPEKLAQHFPEIGAAKYRWSSDPYFQDLLAKGVDSGESWSSRAGGRYDAGFTVGVTIDDSGVEHSKPFKAVLQKANEGYYSETDPNDPERRFIVGLGIKSEETPYEFSFENIHTGYGEQNDAYGMTGTGHAKEVIGKTTELISGALKRFKPPAVFYTAKGDSRASLYEFLTRRVGKKSKEYSGYRLDIDGYDGAFAIVRNDQESNFVDSANEAGVKVIKLDNPKFNQSDLDGNANPPTKPAPYDHPAAIASAVASAPSGLPALDEMRKAYALHHTEMNRHLGKERAEAEARGVAKITDPKQLLEVMEKERAMQENRDFLHDPHYKPLMKHIDALKSLTGAKLDPEPVKPTGEHTKVKPEQANHTSFGTDHTTWHTQKVPEGKHRVTIRGSKDPSKPSYVARLTGTNRQYDFQREFLRSPRLGPDDHHYHDLDDGVYEAHTGDHTGAMSQKLFKIEKGKIKHLNLTNVGDHLPKPPGKPWNEAEDGPVPFQADSIPVTGYHL